MTTALQLGIFLLPLLILASVFCDCSALSLPCRENGYLGDDSYLYRQLESALLNNPDGLYALHTAFFEPNRVSREVVYVHLHLKISHMGPSNCTTAGPNQWSLANGTRDTSGNNDSQLYEYIWSFKWSSSAVLSQINMGELLVFDNLLTPLLYIRVSTSHHRAATITLHVPSLPCKLTDGDVLSTVIAFLTWVRHAVFNICESELFYINRFSVYSPELRPSSSRFMYLTVVEKNRRHFSDTIAVRFTLGKEDLGSRQPSTCLPLELSN